MNKCLACIVLVVALFLSCSQKKNLIPDDYSKWQQTVKELLTYPVPGHLASYRKIFINKIGEKPVETKDANGVDSYNYPEGTIIVKEIYDAKDYTDASKPGMLTCMVKDPKNPASRGGWIWVIKMLPTGFERVISQPFCVTCHANANELHPYGDRNPEGEFWDYVFLPMKEEEEEASE